MRHLTPVILTASLVLGAVSTSWADPRAPLDEVLHHAARVRAEAHRIDQLLGHRQPDMAAVLQRLSVLQERAQVLQRRMADVDVDATILVPHDRDALQTARRASEALAALVSSKATLLLDPGRAMEARQIIRAKARGIARRAAVVELEVSRVRG